MFYGAPMSDLEFESGTKAQEVEDLATACIASVNKTVGIQLDFHPDTLPILDHYAREIEVDEDELLALVAPMCGAYFGEVIRRRFDGVRWHAPKGKYADWRLEFEHMFLYFNPVGMALDVLIEADGPYPSNLVVKKDDAERVEAALNVYADVREEDYYRFGIRLEGIEQAANALVTAASQKKGEKGKRYAASAYVSHEASLRAEAN